MAPVKSGKGRNQGKLIQSYSTGFVGSSLSPSLTFSASGGDLADGLQLHFLEALLYEGVDVELEAHPHAFHDHGAWDSSVQRHSVDVVLAVGVVLAAVEDQAPSFAFLVGEQHFEVESFLVKNLALEQNVRLDQTKICFSVL